MQNIYGVPPHITNQTPHQKQSIGADRGRGWYARYGGGSREHGLGRGSSHSYYRHFETYERYKGPQSIATSNTQEDVTVGDTDSNKSVFEWKAMIKYLCESIIVDVK